MSGAKKHAGLIEVGRVTKAHGIRGEISAEYNADSLALLADSVYLRGRSPDGRENLREYKIRGMRPHKGRPLLLLQGVEDRNAAELLRGFALLVPEERLPAPAEDEIYLRDLPGLEIFVTGGSGEGGENRERLGVLEAVADVAGQEIWTIVTPAGQEVLFPAAAHFVLEINSAEGYALLDPPPGLLELYLG